jgi:putative FmdB family regulatory protein
MLGGVMPVYEFECDKGTVTERLVSMGTRSITCPCCSRRAKKILSLCSFELKGGGWYTDGYSTGRAAKTAQGKSNTPKTAESKADASKGSQKSD